MRTTTIGAAGLGGVLLVAGVLAAPGWVLTVGLVLVLLAAVTGGALLVPDAPLWLRLVVAVGAGGLGAALYGALVSGLADDPVTIALGAGSLLVAAILASRPRPKRRSAGAHAR